MPQDIRRAARSGDSQRALSRAADLSTRNALRRAERGQQDSLCFFQQRSQGELVCNGWEGGSNACDAITAIPRSLLLLVARAGGLLREHLRGDAVPLECPSNAGVGGDLDEDLDDFLGSCAVVECDSGLTAEGF